MGGRPPARPAGRITSTELSSVAAGDGRIYDCAMITKVNVSQEIDGRDQHILALVQRDAKLPQAEIARRVGLSAAAVNERLRKLEHAGVIRRYAAQLDPRAVGVTI